MVLWYFGTFGTFFLSFPSFPCHLLEVNICAISLAIWKKVAIVIPPLWPFMQLS